MKRKFKKKKEKEKAEEEEGGYIAVSEEIDGCQPTENNNTKT